MDKDSKGQRQLEDWRTAASCSGRTQPRIEKNKHSMCCRWSAPRPLERVCWRQFVAQRGDCKHLELRLSVRSLSLSLKHRPQPPRYSGAVSQCQAVRDRRRPRLTSSDQQRTRFFGGSCLSP